MGAPLRGWGSVRASPVTQQSLKGKMMLSSVRGLRRVGGGENTGRPSARRGWGGGQRKGYQQKHRPDK